MRQDLTQLDKPFTKLYKTLLNVTELFTTLHKSTTLQKLYNNFAQTYV